ncbi:sigma-54-dependent Fis family transcriptional regulator [Pseudoduganella namucuonensis]|uniref:Transcriptional regulator of acetoin/glycerol metabolism n=1 Tax=Pseudoduganella namucuonensis TaxID=1035707 RepID=A0A1I7F6H7_9BURK|nr:sigma-54-dependent Fis family transcriptional regulator [Pseudoduganella namucuonensis]SFU31801.1 Transcriptional regulator of acetoin/glycerol metabolism [Pseudoduganella namucuonensis]
MINPDQPRIDPRQRLPEIVRNSWDRSRRYGISPSDSLLLNEVSKALQRRVRERNQRLAGFAAPELAALQHSIGGAGWMLACLDEEGTIVSTFGKSPGASSRLEQVLRTGVSLSEIAVGTNGPGCAIAERKPVVVSGCEHYLQEAKDLVCVAVPVFDPAGELVGALDASSLSHSDAGAAMEGLALAARAIENRLMYDIRNAILIRIHPRSDMLGTPLEGLLALSEDGCVLGLNQTARHLLALVDARGGKIAFETLFDAPFHRTMDRLRAARQAPVQLRGTGGLALHARIGLGGEVRREALRGVKSAPGADLAAGPLAGVTQRDARVEEMLRHARRAYARDIPVLLTGETGTGKEVAARLMHDGGPRALGPFVAINCSAIPASLIESEFFGYVEGAFTGGRSGGAAGKMEQANGGTLFLDEIGDMPHELQGRLLRVLQERSITRLGASKATGIDIAVICATHRDLPRLVAAGGFREDLLYRINGLHVRLPALRERGDIDALILQMLREANAGLELPRISGLAMRTLLGYAWPGNIRQLRHVLRIASMYAEDGGCIEPCHLPEEITGGMRPAARPAVDEPVSLSHIKRNELDFIRGALRATRGNISAAALHIGISRQTLYRKMRLYGIEARQ